MNGLKFEKKLEEYLKYFEEEKTGFFIKSPIPSMIKKINGKNTIIFINKALCDFVGIYKSKFVLIEAKSISTKYWEKRRLKDHQYKQLVKINNLKGVSLIIFEIKKNNYILIYTIEEYNKLINKYDYKNINISILIDNCKKIIKNKEDFLKVFQSIFLN